MNEYLLQIEEGSFAEFCYENGTIEYLENNKKFFSHMDFIRWGLSPEEWHAQIELALKAKIHDRDNDKQMCILNLKVYDIGLEKLEKELNE